MSGAMGFVKRAVPFFVALIIGVFITSFFVDLSRPRFEGIRARGWERYRENQRIRMENEELRNENLRLRNQLNTFGTSDHPHPNWDETTSDEMRTIPPLPPAPPGVSKFRVHTVR